LCSYITLLADTARYISRANPRDAQRHVIVGVQSYKPTDFARQMNVSITNGWGIVRTIADLALKQPEGKYVLVKDPNNVSTVPPHRVVCFIRACFADFARVILQPMIRLYSVPDNAFDAEGATVDGHDDM
jgi:translation initiation factor 3 subunit D